MQRDDGPKRLRKQGWRVSPDSRVSLINAGTDRDPPNRSTLSVFRGGERPGGFKQRRTQERWQPCPRELELMPEKHADKAVRAPFLNRPWAEQAILPRHTCFIDRPISYWVQTADRRGNNSGIGCTVIECDEIIGFARWDRPRSVGWSSQVGPPLGNREFVRTNEFHSDFSIPFFRRGRASTV